MKIELVNDKNILLTDLVVYHTMSVPYGVKQTNQEEHINQFQ